MTGEYEFELRFALPGCDVDMDEVVESLAEAGCDDALIGIGRPGQVALDFTREAESAEKALLSAIANVKKGVPEARLLEVSPDLVGLTDVGDLLHVSRQNMRKLLLDCRGAPPSAVHDGKPALWHLSDVLEWLQANKGYKVPATLSSLAKTAKQVNLAVSASQLDRETERKVARLLG